MNQRICIFNCSALLVCWHAGLIGLPALPGSGGTGSVASGSSGKHSSSGNGNSSGSSGRERGAATDQQPAPISSSTQGQPKGEDGLFSWLLLSLLGLVLVVAVAYVLEKQEYEQGGGFAQGHSRLLLRQGGAVLSYVWKLWRKVVPH
jgi:hypothetical protein